MFSKKIYYTLLLLLSLAGLSSCSLEDDRDLCCDRLTLHYRYIRQDYDEYKSVITSMRHFLFDHQGLFLREISNPSSDQDLRLDGLPVGRYTVLTLANATAQHNVLTDLVASRSTLSDFQLSLSTFNTNGSYANSDQLFWNTRTIEAIANRQSHYICDLSNIHCHLFIKVRWYTLPSHSGPYTMQLSQVPVGYNLFPTASDTIVIKSDGSSDAQSSSSRVVHTFPSFSGSFGTHEISVPLYDLELDGEFVTLRYSDDHIPMFQLFNGTEAVTKAIDLSRAFKQWNWYPDSHSEQIYKIEMTIYDDGRVVLNQWAEATVMDWIDGGAVGTIK